MRLVKNMIFVLLLTGSVYAKQTTIRATPELRAGMVPESGIISSTEMPPIVVRTPEVTPEVVMKPVDISTLPLPMNAPEVMKKQQHHVKKREAKEKKERAVLPQPKEKVSMQEYARNTVNNVSKKVVNDIFPKKDTIERIVFDVKDKYMGPDKEDDIAILYDAIISNPEIKKHITLQNAVPTYRFIKESLSKAWDKNDNLVWSRA